MRPAAGESTEISIFMDSMIASTSPAATLAPSSTRIFQMLPGTSENAPTWPSGMPVATAAISADSAGASSSFSSRQRRRSASNAACCAALNVVIDDCAPANVRA